MRYSFTFLGIIAFSSTSLGLATPSPDTTGTTTLKSTDPCKSTIQTIMAPLAKDPWAKKFCAAKFPSETTGVSAREVELVAKELEARGTPLWTQLGLDEKDVLETFCKCNYGSNGRGRGSTRKYRGRIKRWVVEEDA